MTIQTRTIIDHIRKVSIAATDEHAANTIYEVKRVTETYDDAITPVEAVDAVTEMQPVIIPASPATYEKNDNGALVKISAAVKSYPAMTEYVKATYNYKGEELTPAIEAEPILEEVVVTPAIEAVTDVTEVSPPHRSTYAEADLPEDVSAHINTHGVDCEKGI